MGTVAMLGLLTGIVLLPLFILACSFVRTAGGLPPDLSFDRRDRCRRSGYTGKRRFQSPGHLLRRCADTLGYAYPLLQVYLFRKISPAFREKIMIITAMANQCPQ